MSVNMADSGNHMLNEATEQELVRGVIAGDRASYGVLYDRFAPLVRAICHDLTHNLADAQDLAQDVFLRAYQRLGELRKPESFGSWIVGMTRRRCSEWRRQKMRERRKHAACGIKSQLAQDIGWIEEDGQLLGLIAGLNDDERLALHAFYLQDKSAEEARRIMGLSRSGFYKLLDRARMKLRRQWEQHEEKIQ